MAVWGMVSGSFVFFVFSFFCWAGGGGLCFFIIAAAGSLLHPSAPEAAAEPVILKLQLLKL